MMPAPACMSGVIAVGAVYDSNAGRQPPQAVGTTYQARWGSAFAACSDATSSFDRIACFTNSTMDMDLLAPGAPIVSDSLRGRTEMFWGTSQAAPAAAGVAALMLECAPELTPEQIKDAMLRTGVPVTDARNGLTFPSLRALAAVEAVCSEVAPPILDAGTADAEREASVPPYVEPDTPDDSDFPMEEEAAEPTKRDASRPSGTGGSQAPRTDRPKQGCSRRGIRPHHR